MTRPTARDDTGSVTVFFAVTALALFAVFGLVLDAGRALAAKASAASDAFAAARAAAQQIAPARLRAGTTTLDPTAATDAANRVLAADHLTGVTTVHADTVTVTITRSVPTEVLGLVGIRTVTVTATGTATATPGP